KTARQDDEGTTDSWAACSAAVAGPASLHPHPEMGASGMTCYLCGQAAERACTRCGRFFCSTHGGDRLGDEGAGEGYHVVARGLCNNCTPDQREMRSLRVGLAIVPLVLVGIGVIIGIVLLLHSW